MAEMDITEIEVTGDLRQSSKEPGINDQVDAIAWERRERKRSIIKKTGAVALIVLAGFGLTKWKAITDANAARFEEREAKELTDLADKALPSFKQFVTSFDDETVPAKITIDANPKFVRSDYDGKPQLVDGRIRVTLGRCAKQFLVQPDETGVFTVYEPGSYGDPGVNPFAIIQDQKVIGQKPPTEQGLVEMFPADCATNDQERVAIVAH